MNQIRKYSRAHVTNTDKHTNTNTHCPTCSQNLRVLMSVSPLAAVKCGACGSNILDVDGQLRTDSQHRCRYSSCPNGRHLHSSLLCAHVWEPIEGVYFCARACLDAHNIQLGLNGVVRLAEEPRSGIIVPRRKPGGAPEEPSYVTAERQRAVMHHGSMIQSVIPWYPDRQTVLTSTPHSLDPIYLVYGYGSVRVPAQCSTPDTFHIWKVVS